MIVTVYGRPGCVQCTYTLRKMDEYGVAYDYIDVGDADMTTLAEFTSLPVVLVDHPSYTDSWCGFKLDKIRGLQHAF